MPIDQLVAEGTNSSAKTLWISRWMSLALPAGVRQEALQAQHLLLADALAARGAEDEGHRFGTLAFFAEEQTIEVSERVALGFVAPKPGSETLVQVGQFDLERISRSSAQSLAGESWVCGSEQRWPTNGTRRFRRPAQFRHGA